jgi:hypothetical protein
MQQTKTEAEEPSSSAPYHVAAARLNRDDGHDHERDRIHDDQLAIEDEAPEVAESRDNDHDFLRNHEQTDRPRHYHADANREVHVPHPQARHEMAAHDDLSNPGPLLADTVAKGR